MKLDGISFGSIKGFDSQQEVRLRDLNLIYGANSSGKSSIFQALMLLQQSAQRAFSAEAGVLEFRGAQVDLGGFRTFVHRHDTSSPMKIGLMLSDVAGAHGNRDFFEGDVRLDFDFILRHPASSESELARVAIGSGRKRIEFRLDADRDGMYLADADSSGAIVDAYFDLLEMLEPRVRKGLAMSEKDKRWLRQWARTHVCDLQGWIPYWSPSSLGRGKPGRPLGGSKESPRNQLVETFVYWWEDWAYSFGYQLYGLLRDVVYVGPLREFPRRVVTEAAVGEGPGSRGEGLVLHLARNADLVDKVNDAFGLLEIPYRLRVDWLQAKETEDALGDVAVAVLTDVRTQVVVSPADVGFGLSQILPVVVQLVGNQGKTILVEQPEIHLHPKMQSRIADVMLDSIRNGRNRLLIETHSEHILLRAQRRLREQREATGASGAEVLSVYYVNSSASAGVVTRLSVDESGRVVDPWPDGFFDERLEDLLLGGS